jgi:phage host-nuclease inhibitor protein Gam
MYSYTSSFINQKEIIMITRIKKSLAYVPASLSETVTFLISIGNKQREINRVKREAKKRVEAINTDTQITVSELTKERDAFFTSLFAFSSARKEELTKVTRSQKTEAGTFGWRWTTPYVDLKEGKSDQDIIASLKRKGLTEYIRTIEEVDREALLRDRPEVPGVSYSQRDEFFAKPKLAKEDGRAEELVKTEAIDV